MTNVLALHEIARMATHVKDVLRAGTFRKGAQQIRVSRDDLDLARLNFEKMKRLGYRVPVIIEHAKPDDPEGLPVKQEQISARDRAKYQAGWSEDLRLNDKGILEVAMDVKSADGRKLVDEVGTYVSPQFGPWTFPGDDKPTPMVITHFALTPYPVDIGQDPEFRPAVDAVSATQLSHLVSFSMADYVPDESEESANSEAPAVPESPDTTSEAPSVSDQMPNTAQANTFRQINEALKMLGVILPESVSHADNPEALLAALMTCAHHANEAKAAEAAAQQTVMQSPAAGQDQNQDPRMNGTKQEGTFTMSQTADLKTLPEFVSMSQTLEVLTAENSKMRKAEYNQRIESLVKSGRIQPTKAQEFLATVGTYQFSVSTTSTDFIKLDAQLEYAESLPEGAIWSPDERIKQMGLTEHKPGAFFSSDAAGMDEAEMDADMDRRFGKLASR